MTCQPTMFIFCCLHLRSLVGILNNELNIGRRWNTRRTQVQRANRKNMIGYTEGVEGYVKTSTCLFGQHK